MADFEYDLSRYALITGFIDAKDEKQSSVYGIFLGLASPRDLKYFNTRFSHKQPGKDMPWFDLLSSLNAQRTDEPAEALLSMETRLGEYIDMSRLIQGVAKNRNLKPAEQSISRFCAEQLHLKAVTFAKFEAVGPAEVSRFLDEIAKDQEKKDGQPEETAPAPGDQNSETEDGGGEEAKDLFIKCEPILDPVKGVPISELSVGDLVYGKLPDDSVFLKLFIKRFPNFDGIMTGEVTGIFINELGTATVSLNMSDGISGLMKLSGKVRIKKAEKPQDEKNKNSFELGKAIHNIPPEIVFGVAGFFILICFVLLILYIIS